MIEEVEFHGNIIAKTEDNYCPFLSPSGECTIYEYRSDLCRKFGDESCILMTCQWQDKDGRLRGRPERKRIGLAIMEKYKLMILDR